MVFKIVRRKPGFTLIPRPCSGFTLIELLVVIAIIAQLLFLEAEDPKKEIKMYINSPGGSVTAALAIQTKEMLRIKGQVDKILADHTGQSIKKIETDTDRDFFMTAEDAKKYGIIDKIIQ